MLVFMALFNLIMLICAVRTNIIFVMVFICLECAFCFVAASNFYGSKGDLGAGASIGMGGNYHYYRVVSEHFSWTFFSDKDSLTL